MRMSVRVLPWLLALLGLAIPLVGSGFVVWFPIVFWMPLLALVWVTSRCVSITRGQRIAMALVMLPILFVLIWEGGWWLMPADLAWFAIEVADRDWPNR
jgi:hypothetical protein